MVNSQLQGLDSIIFDLDGTLWDASPACTKAWNTVLESFGYAAHVLDETAIRSFSGQRVEVIFDQHFYFIPQEKRKELLEAYKRKESEMIGAYGGILYPGVRETLVELKKQYRLFIVSNCLTGYIEHFIHHAKLPDVFLDHECSGNTSLPKSNNIKSIIERNCLLGPVYVGDTFWDWEAAKSNNVPFVWAAYGFGIVPEAKFKIDDITILQKLLASKTKGQL